MFEISCVVDKQANMDYFMFAQGKGLKTIRTFGIVCFVLSIVYALICFTGEIVIDELYFDVFIILVLLICGSMLVFLIKPLLLKTFNRTYESNKFLQSNPVYTFQFNENNYKTLITSNLGMEESTYSYAMLNAVFDTNKYFYLCFSTNSAYIINKSAGDSETITNISNILKEKLGNKYIVVKQK